MNPAPFHPAYVVAVGRTNYVLGLAWRSMPGLPGYTPTDEAGEVVKKHAARMGVLSQLPGRPIIGVLPPKTRTPSGKLYCAALVLARRAPAIYALRVDDGRVWLCRCGGNQLPIDTDHLLTLEQANTHIDQVCTAEVTRGKSTPRIITTADIKLTTPFSAGVETTTLAELLAEPTVEAQLVAYGNTPVGRKLLWGAVAALVLFAIGQTVWDTWRAHQKKIDALATDQNLPPDQRNNERLRAAAEAQAVASALRADTAGPDPVAFTETCVGLYENLGRFVAGWSLRSFHCDASAQAATASLAIVHPALPTFGTPASLHAYATTLGGSSVVDPSFSAATLTIPLAMDVRPGLTKPTELPDYNAFVTNEGTALMRKRRADTLLQVTLGAPLPKPIRYTDPVPIQPGQGAPPMIDAPADRTYRTLSGNLSGIHPWRLPYQLLADHPNALLTSLDITPAGSYDTTVASFNLVFRP